jgi:hypothetical protein
MSMPTREELALMVDMARWEWLREHLERGGLIVVAPELDLVEAGIGIAVDDTAALQGWIAAGAIARPSPEQLFDWDATPETMFRMLIISPFVLIQPLNPGCS